MAKMSARLIQAMIKVTDSRSTETDVLDESEQFNIVGNFTIVTPNNNEDWKELKFEWSDGWMCGVSLREMKPSEKLRKMMGIAPIMDVVTRSRHRWMEHVLRKHESDCVRRVMEMKLTVNAG